MNWDERLHAKYPWWYAFELIVIVVIFLAILWWVVKR